jgi:hypothetical protein
VQVHYDEGVAIHIGPKPCVGIREDGDEASVGEGIGQPLSREWVPTLFRAWKATRTDASSRALVDPAWSKNLACAEAPWTGTGRSRVWPVADRSGPHREGEEP